MFNCIDCVYTSNRKLNLESHTKRKHSRELKEEEKINKKTSIPFENKVIPLLNKVIPFENKVIPLLNTVIINKYECNKCTKVLKTKNNLKNHINICKGVLNPLECHYCHKTLCDYSSKSKHIKTCKAKAGILTVKEEEAKVINITNNITLINFNMKNNEYTKFVTDHISDKEVIRLIKDNKTNFNHLIEAYLGKLYDNPMNICIRKICEKSGYSEVIEEGKWNKKLDSIVYPHLVKDVSNGLFDKVDILMDDEKVKGRIVGEIHEYLSEIMVHSIDKDDIEILKNAKDVMRRIKCFMLNQ